MNKTETEANHDIIIHGGKQVQRKRYAETRRRLSTTRIFSGALILMFSASFALYANDANRAKVEILIDQGLFKNESAIAKASAKLTDSDRLLLYDAHKKDPTLPFLLNLILPCGIGSYVQGDNTGGTITLAGEAAGIAVIAVGAVAFATSNATSFTVSGSTPTINGTGLVVIGAGSIAILAFKIFSLTRPFSYSSNYDKTLQHSLYGDSISDSGPVFYGDIASAPSGGLSTEIGLKFFL